MTLPPLPPGLDFSRNEAELVRLVPSGNVLPLASLRPRDTAEIERAVKWANRNGQKLLPVSSSGSRLHGSTATEAPVVVIDLAAMKRIRNVDALDAIAVIEPGLTFPEFDAQLAAHGLRSYKPLLPRRGKSVVASYLEREPITSPRDQWDAADPLATVELVFGSGEKFRTGSAGSEEELEEQLEHGLRQMSSLGPFSTDFTRVIMGSQGSLGIVSWASVYCERIPSMETAYFVPAEDLPSLVTLSSRIGWRKLGAQCFIMNNVQLALIAGRDRGEVLDLAERLPPWSLFVNIAAPDYFPAERIEYEVEALLEDCDTLGLAPCKQLEGFEADAITWMQNHLPEQHYKARFEASVDEIFFLNQSDRAASLVDIFQAAHRSSGNDLPIAIYIQPRVQSSSAHIEFTSFWNPGEPRQATFHADTSRALSDGGAFFSRPYGVWKDIAYARDAQIVPHLRKVKAMFDPNSVMNPGKFC